MADSSEPNINCARVEVCRRTTASTHERTHISSSPASGWTTSFAHCSGAEGDTEIPDHSVSESASKNCDATASQAVRGSGGTKVQHEHNSPQINTSLPHEHVRSLVQGKPRRGSPYPLLHDTGDNAHAHEDVQRSTGSSSNARTQHRAAVYLHMSDPLAQSPRLDQQPLTTQRPSPHAQPRGSMNYPGSPMVTDKLIDLAYKITDGMSFKVPPSTPRRPDLPA